MIFCLLHYGKFVETIYLSSAISSAEYILEFATLTKDFEACPCVKSAINEQRLTDMIV